MRRDSLGVGGAALALCLAGCGGAPPPDPVPSVQTPVLVTLEALEADSVADVLIDRLMASEAALEEPDSLFAEAAIVIADGEVRPSVPRLAGIGLGGLPQLVTSRVAARGAFVWAVIEYRWLPLLERDEIRVGVATVVLAALPDGSWRIVHLHSSSPPPPMPQPGPPDTLGDPGRGGGI